MVNVEVYQEINKYQAQRQFPDRKVLGVEREGKTTIVKLGGKKR